MTGLRIVRREIASFEPTSRRTATIGSRPAASTVAHAARVASSSMQIFPPVSGSRARSRCSVSRNAQASSATAPLPASSSARETWPSSSPSCARMPPNVLGAATLAAFMSLNVSVEITYGTQNSDHVSPSGTPGTRTVFVDGSAS